MEENITPIQSEKTTGKLKSFFIASFLTLAFCVFCIPFLINANNLSYAEKVSIGQINLWRIVIIFGVLSLITTIFSIIKKKKNKLIIIFLWMFWILGTILVVLISNKNGGIQLSPSIFTNSASIVGIVPILP